MTRHQMIERAAEDVAESADFSAVGTEDIFGNLRTADDVVSSVAAAVARLQSVLGMTDAEWSAKWAASEAEENRVEADAQAFAAGKG